MLRMDEDRLVCKAAKYIAENRSEGDLFMDVPAKFSWCELRELAKDRVGWRSRVMALRAAASPASDNKTAPAISVTINRSLPGCRATTSKPPSPTHCKMVSPSKMMVRK